MQNPRNYIVVSKSTERFDPGGDLLGDASFSRRKAKRKPDPFLRDRVRRLGNYSKPNKDKIMKVSAN